jgi:hypothetical protein
MALVGQAQVCITGDTALMHAAAGVGTKTVALFGPTNPVETGPYGDGHWVLAGPCPERPCFRFDCPHLRCMESIPPAAVLACLDTKGRPAGCDAFTTSLAPCGDYRLVPAGEFDNPYIDPASAVTRLAIGERSGAAAIDLGDRAREESLVFIDTVRQMAGSLRGYLAARRTEEIAAFTRRRDHLDTLHGIGSFWTALLTIRLNSVPLLDIEEGARRSLAECEKTVMQVEHAVRLSTDSRGGPPPATD